MIIDPTYLNTLLIAWGTFGHIKIIYIVTQYFCKVHDFNSKTSKLITMTKFEAHYFSFFGCPIKALVNEK